MSIIIISIKFYFYSLSPSDIFQKIKGVSNSELRKVFVHLDKMSSLWIGSYFVSIASNVHS